MTTTDEVHSVKMRAVVVCVLPGYNSVQIPSPHLVLLSVLPLPGEDACLATVVPVCDAAIAEL